MSISTRLIFWRCFRWQGLGARLIGTVRDERADRAETLKFEDVSDRAIQHLKLQVNKVNWFSTYHVHHRVTEHFRKGRAFLLGDAAHIHSPAGGQGMNTGIGDAINLAWKLAAVLQGRAPDSLLDSYEAERIGFARRLVATTDRAFSLATADGWLADILRTRIVPFLMPKLTTFEAVREYMFRTVSQITLNYRGGPLSKGAAGHVHGGDRLPWVPIDGSDNFEPLAAMTWQVHVYGSPMPELRKWCSEHNIPLHIFDWRSDYERAGLARNALYLLRPDTYVALADATGAPAVVEQQIVIVENVLALLGLHIGLEQAAKVLFKSGAPGEVLLEHAIESLAGIDCLRIDGKAGRLERKSLLLVRKAQTMPDEI